MSVGVAGGGVPPLAGSIELILFDAVGTLIEPDPSVAAAYHSAGSSRGCLLSPEAVGARFKTAWRRSVLAQLSGVEAGRTSEELERKRWRAIVREVFAELDEASAELIFSQLWDHFAEPRHWRVFPDVAPTLQELCKRGYRIGIASNFDARLLNICRAHECLASIDPLFISSQVGWSKPAPQFYWALEKITGVKPQRILFVGDDYENDVAVPRSLGWQACWLQRDQVSSADSLALLTELLSAVSK